MSPVESILFRFVLLNGDVPNVEAIFFVSIEQKKRYSLQKLPGVLVISTDEGICSASK